MYQFFYYTISYRILLLGSKFNIEYLEMLLKGAFFLLSVTYLGLITEKEAASISNGKIIIFDHCTSIKK